MTTNLQIDEGNNLIIMDEQEQNPCVICCEDLVGNKPSHELPECGHKFHQLCINTWFRQGNSKCPLCNNNGAGFQASNKLYYGDWKIKYDYMKRFAKKNSAPHSLKKIVKRITKRQESIKKGREELTSLKKEIVIVNGESITIKDLINKCDKRSMALRRRGWALKRTKNELVYKYNIVPLILVEKKQV